MFFIGTTRKKEAEAGTIQRQLYKETCEPSDRYVSDKFRLSWGMELWGKKVMLRNTFKIKFCYTNVKVYRKIEKLLSVWHLLTICIWQLPMMYCMWPIYLYGCLCLHFGSEVVQSCPTLCNPMNWGLRGSSIHGIFQTRVLECVVISSSRGSSRPRDGTQSPAL